LACLAGTVRQLEQHLEAVLAAFAVWRVRIVLRGAGIAEQISSFGADVRLHCCSCSRLRRRSKRGQEHQALGRSRGGFSTKIHLKTDFDGDYLAFELTGGEKADAPQFSPLLDLGPDITPRAAMGDKGYDSKANRQAARSRGIIPVIPYRQNAKDKPEYFPKTLYKGRARIEQGVGKLKRFKRIALRCEKTALNFLSFVHLAAGFILIKSVHTA
jgi:transposase